MLPDLSRDETLAWLGAIQAEIGVYVTNLKMLETRCATLTRRASDDAEMIAALTDRALRAEADLRDLRAQHA